MIACRYYITNFIIINIIKVKGFTKLPEIRVFTLLYVTLPVLVTIRFFKDMTRMDDSFISFIMTKLI